MVTVVGAVTLLGVVSLLQLIVLIGVVRKLKEHGLALSARRPVLQPSLRPGQPIGEFSARTVDGERLAPEDLPDGTEVGFFSPTCAPCWDRLSGFARPIEGRPRRVAVVVAGGVPAAEVPAGDDGAVELSAHDADTRRMVRRLGTDTTVVLDRISGPVTGAFGVFGFPVTVTVRRDPDGRLLVGEPAAATAVRP